MCQFWTSLSRQLYSNSSQGLKIFPYGYVEMYIGTATMKYRCDHNAVYRLFVKAKKYNNIEIKKYWKILNK